MLAVTISFNQMMILKFNGKRESYCGILNEKFLLHSQPQSFNFLIFHLRELQNSHIPWSNVFSFQLTTFRSHLRAFSAPLFSTLTMKRHHPSMDMHSSSVIKFLHRRTSSKKKNIRNYLSSFVKREKYFFTWDRGRIRYFACYCARQDSSYFIFVASSKWISFNYWAVKCASLMLL